MGRRISSPRLVGRGDELRDLVDLFDRARAGHPGVALVGGEAGIGKSRLTRAVAGQVRDEGARVLVGHCLDLGDSALPFAPLIEAFRALARTEEPSRLPELLGPARRELGRIVPGLVDGPAHPPAEGSAEQRGRLAAAAADVVERLSRDRPLVLILEDVHWADQATLGLVDYLARTFAEEPVLLVATYRTEELHRHHPLVAALGELSRLPSVTRLELAPLDRDEIAELIAAILDEEPQAPLVDRIAQRSGGNAFFVEELVAAGSPGASDERVPPGLRDVVGARLHRLPAVTGELLSRVAAAGQRVGGPMLEEIAGLDVEVLAETLRPAIDQRVLEVDDDGYRFRHALVQEVVLADLLPGERRTLHRRVAEALERHPELAAGGADQAPAELAHHWHAARVPDRTLAASLAAAEHAEGLGAFAEARRHYERALAVCDETADVPHRPDRFAIRRAAARAAHLGAEPRRAVEHLETLLQHPEADGDPGEQATIRMHLSRSLSALGEVDAALVQARQACDLLAEAEPSGLRAAALATLAGAQLVAVQEAPGRAMAPAQEALRVARAVGDRRTESRVLQALGVGLGMTGKLDEGVAHLRAALEMARDLDDPHSLMDCYQNLLGMLYRQDVLGVESTSRELVDEVLCWLDGGGDRWPRSGALLEWPVYAYLRSGDWSRAQEMLTRQSHHRLDEMRRLIHHVMRGTLRWMQGRLDDAAAEIAHVRRRGLISRLHHDFFPLEAETAAGRGRLDEARSLAAEHLDLVVDASEEPMKAGTLRPLVQAEVDAALAVGPAARTEHVARAREILTRMEELATGASQAATGSIQLELADTYLLLARGELSRVTGPDPQLWARAVQAAGYAYWRLYARMRHAEALLAVGDDGPGMEALTAAHARATELGADGIRTSVEAIARDAGRLLPGMRVTDPGELGLTPREAEILRLLAEDRTNRDIGEALHISDKTVSVHLSNAFTKLGVDNRAQAASRATELGLVPATEGI